MKHNGYVNLHGETISLKGLDAAERVLVNRLRRRARTNPGWGVFSNYAAQGVGDFYDGRGVSRKKSGQSPVMCVALDLGNRLGIAEGKIALPSLEYRDQLERLVLQYPTRRAFCKAAGIAE